MITTMTEEIKTWEAERIRQDQIDRYLKRGRDFIPDDEIEARLAGAVCPDASWVREILAKAMEIQTLSPDETAALLAVRNPELWREMEEAGAKIKNKVYDNRIVTFAPLYLSNHCVNNCAYCGLRRDNEVIHRNRLTQDEVRAETEALAGRIGHKRLIVVYGEHPDSGLDYITETMRTIYRVKVKTRRGWGAIRRVNVNAAPMAVEELKELGSAGLGTYQVFQETYHKKTYARLHPKGTLKGNYLWRLYSMHRALEAGVDDVGVGVLFGLGDWRFEVMALLYHAIELEAAMGIGPHTISFPRMEPAANTPFTASSRHQVSDADFQRAITVLRLAVPYTGMILTARENAAMRRSLMPLGITQTDASSRIKVGAYGEADQPAQEGDRQQFQLGDTRSLDEVVRELAQMGYITSFCTAGYRCGRTGKCIMDLLRSGQEGKFCKLNAVLTFREWLDDFASPETKVAGEPIVEREIGEIRARMPKVLEQFMDHYRRTSGGERDLYF
ncbi:MAG: [FeFe] hydrogenase H-cluster radical SAM maturase HydG [Verrucomicrobiae bacterium]|nr:[FeFe] hydrogenase H-cluster radical SAM maturase HydG [Verrucomicrobiae bacterium]